MRLSNARYAPIADAVGVVTITDDDDPPALVVADRIDHRGRRRHQEPPLLPRPRRAVGQDRQGDASRPTTAPRPRRRTSAHASGTKTFTPGVTSVPVAVPIVGDLAAEPTETFKLLVTGTQNAQLLDSLARGTILDDD